jgi:hypothetical protein
VHGGALIAYGGAGARGRADRVLNVRRLADTLHNLTRYPVDFDEPADDHLVRYGKELVMVKNLGALLLCAAVNVPAAHAETFVIQGESLGHEATIRIPVGAVTKLSANFAESLVGYGDPQFEAMRLSGDVLISISGSAQPIQIKADDVVLELTPDTANDPPKRSRSDAAANRLLRSTTTLPGDDGAQVFVGNVVFNLQTSSGPMEIKADRVEHQLERNRPAREAGV